MFSVTADPDRKLIAARMWGFMTLEEVTEFSRQEQDAVEAMGCGTGEFLLLVDTVGAVIQSQEVVAGFIDIVANSRLRARRIAVVRESTLTRMQTRRILMIRDGTAMFESVADAEKWLFADENGETAAA